MTKLKAERNWGTQFLIVKNGLFYRKAGKQGPSNGMGPILLKCSIKVKQIFQI